MNKIILAIAGVMIIIFVLIFSRINESNAGLRYDGNIPYVPPIQNSSEVERSVYPDAPFGEVAARLIVVGPFDNKEQVLWFQNKEYKAYVELLSEYGWEKIIHPIMCHYIKFAHDDTVSGPGWTLSVREEYNRDPNHRITAVITRGYNTGPQSCSDL